MSLASTMTVAGLEAEKTKLEAEMQILLGEKLKFEEKIVLLKAVPQPVAADIVQAEHEFLVVSGEIARISESLKKLGKALKR